jgi:predicted TIM-barrel fold metal-dependent hydrolase
MMSGYTIIDVDTHVTETPERITSGLSDCDESVRRKILWDNAQKLYKVEGPTAADEAKRAAALGA